MRSFRNNKVAVLVGCFALLFGLVTTSVFSAQTKTKKNTKAENTATAENKTPVDINTASEQELQGLPGIGAALAKRIVAARPYSSVSELSKAGVPNRTIKKITPMVTVGSASTARETKSSTSEKKPASDTDVSSPSKSPSTASASARTEQAPGGGNGKVWVNTKSGVYHKEGDRWYGKTKAGKYMTEDEAIKAGYRADHEKQSEKKE